MATTSSEISAGLVVAMKLNILVGIITSLLERN
jgi:hypothetical protein